MEWIGVVDPVETAESGGAGSEVGRNERKLVRYYISRSRPPPRPTNPYPSSRNEYNIAEVVIPVLLRFSRNASIATTRSKTEDRGQFLKIDPDLTLNSSRATNPTLNSGCQPFRSKQQNRSGPYPKQ